MRVEVLSTYIKLCEFSKVKPTFRGLKKFNKSSGYIDTDIVKHPSWYIWLMDLLEKGIF